MRRLYKILIYKKVYIWVHPSHTDPILCSGISITTRFPANNFFIKLYLRNLLTSRMLTVMILILRNTLSSLVLPAKIYGKQSPFVFYWITNCYFRHHSSSCPIWSFGYPIALLTILISLHALSSPFGSCTGSTSLMIEFSNLKKSPQVLPVSSENSTKKTIVAIQAVLGLLPNYPVYKDMLICIQHYISLFFYYIFVNDACLCATPK